MNENKDSTNKFSNSLVFVWEKKLHSSLSTVSEKTFGDRKWATKKRANEKLIVKCRTDIVFGWKIKNCNAKLFDIVNSVRLSRITYLHLTYSDHSTLNLYFKSQAYDEQKTSRKHFPSSNFNTNGKENEMQRMENAI